MSQLCHLEKHQMNTPVVILEQFQGHLVMLACCLHGTLESQHPMCHPLYRFVPHGHAYEEHP